MVGMTESQYEEKRVNLAKWKNGLAEQYADKVDLGGCLNENEVLLIRW